MAGGWLAGLGAQAATKCARVQRQRNARVCRQCAPAYEMRACADNVHLHACNPHRAADPHAPCDPRPKSSGPPPQPLWPKGTRKLASRAAALGRPRPRSSGASQRASLWTRSSGSLRWSGSLPAGGRLPAPGPGSSGAQPHAAGTRDDGSATMQPSQRTLTHTHSTHTNTHRASGLVLDFSCRRGAPRALLLVPLPAPAPPRRPSGRLKRLRCRTLRST